MKKLLVLLALCMVISVVLVACNEPENPEETTDNVTTETPSEQPSETEPPTTADPGTDDPGTDDPGTDDPGTDDPGTDDPGTDDPGTDNPPVDPDPVTTHISFDELDMVLDGTETDVFTPGGSANWDKTVNVEDYHVQYLKVWGWAAFYGEAVGEFGYQINDDAPVFSADFAVEPGADVIAAANGKPVSRFAIMIPVRELSGEFTVKALVRDAVGTVEEICVATVTKAVDPDAPVILLDAAAVQATASGAAAGNHANQVGSAVLADDGSYVTLTSAESGGDPWILFRNVNVNAQFIAVKYRTTVANKQYHYFASSTGNDATGAGDMSDVHDYVADGNWHVDIIDISGIEKVDDACLISFLRYDFYTNGTNEAIDVAWIGAFNTAEAAEAYFEKTLPPIDFGAVTAPEATFAPESFAQPTIDEIKAGYTYDIGAGQFFQTITGACTYTDLTQLSEGAQAALKAAGFGQYAYYAQDHISIAPPMTGEKLIVTMKIFDVVGNIGSNPEAFLLLNMTGGQQNSGAISPAIEADPTIPGVYTLTFTENVPGGTDELKFYMTQTCGFYIASVYAEIYIPGEDPNYTNLNFDSDVGSNFANSQNNIDPKQSDLANLFDQIIYAAGDPMFVAYNDGNSFYHVAGFSAMHTRPSGNYAYTVNITGTAGAEGFAGLFVRGLKQATNEKNFYGGDGNDDGSSHGGAGIYINYLARGLGYAVRINIKTYADGKWTPNIYYVPVDSSEITVVDDGSIVTILAGGKKIATVEVIGTKDYGINGVAADALSEKVILTLADGTVEELVNAVVATSIPSSDLGIATRTGVIEFNRVSLKPADSVEIPADFYLPVEKENLAQGKPVSADSVENDTNIPSNATDGNAGTRWGATPSGVANLIVDLEAVYELEEIVGSFENAGWKYEVSVSVDGESYQVVHTSEAHGGIVVRIPVDVEARYIKFTRLDDSANPGSHWFSLWEVYAFSK